MICEVLTIDKQDVQVLLREPLTDEERAELTELLRYRMQAGWAHARKRSPEPRPLTPGYRQASV